MIKLNKNQRAWLELVAEGLDPRDYGGSVGALVNHDLVAWKGGQHGRWVLTKNGDSELRRKLSASR